MLRMPCSPKAPGMSDPNARAEGSFRRALAFGKGSFILDIAWQRVYENLVAR